MRRIECEREAARAIAAALLPRRLDPFGGAASDRPRPCANLDEHHTGPTGVATYRCGRWAGTGERERPPANGERP